MSNIKEKALEYHAAGFNCAQSVLAACKEYTGLDDSAALAISAGFGGGLRSGEICGAISGAVMALGLVCPFNEADNAEAKVKIAELAESCVSSCKEEYDYIRCLDLKRSGVNCSEIIGKMAEIAENMIIKAKEN